MPNLLLRGDMLASRIVSHVVLYRITLFGSALRSSRVDVYSRQIVVVPNMCQIIANRPAKYDSTSRISDHRVTRRTCTKRKMSAFWLRLNESSVSLLLQHHIANDMCLQQLTQVWKVFSPSLLVSTPVDSRPEHLTSGCPLAANSCITENCCRIPLHLWSVAQPPVPLFSSTGPNNDHRLGSKSLAPAISRS